MSYLVYFEDLSGEDYQQQENEKVEYLTHPPTPGDRISLGTERLWNIVGVDSYRHPENPEDMIYLAHCTIDSNNVESVERANWFRVKAYRNREPNLQLFLSEGMLLHVNENLTGSRPEAGYLLPQYNVQEHTVTDRPWGIISVSSYVPISHLDCPTYRAIHLCECVYVPEALSSDSRVGLVMA